MTNQESPQAWKIVKRGDTSFIVSEENVETISAITGKKSTKTKDIGAILSEKDAQHIVKCVNTHDELVDIVEQVMDVIATYPELKEKAIEVLKKTK